MVDEFVDMVRGVYTNRKTLFDAINNLEKNKKQILFMGLMTYENKKFNYSNLVEILNILLPGEKFFINIIDDKNILHVYEIKKFELNK